MTRPPPLCAFCLVAAAVACGGPNAADVDPCQDSDASRAAFASEVAAALQGLPDAPRFRYEAADFRLVEAVEGGAPRLIELARARNEWCAGDAEQRARILTQLAALAVRARSVPSSFESARRELLPAMRSRMYAVSADRMVAAMPMKSLAGRPIAEHLWLALVVDRPGHLLFVTEKDLADWRVSFDDALATATDNLRRRSAEAPAEVLPGLYAWHSDEGWAGGRMVLTERIRNLPVKGDPVVIAAAPTDVFIAGTDDDAALAALAGRAAEVLAGPRATSGIAYRLRSGDGWEPFLPRPGSSARDALHALQLAELAGAYADDERYRERSGAQGNPLVATYVVVGSPAGGRRSIATLSRGVPPTLLPRVEWVAFLDPRQDGGFDKLGVARWDDVAAALGPALEPVEGYPPRWKVARFPTDDELRKMDLREEPSR